MNPATVEFQRLLIRAGRMALGAWAAWLDALSRDHRSGPPAAPSPEGPRDHAAALGTSEASR